MNRQVLVAGVAVVALVCGLSACGGSDKKAAPKPTATTAATPAVPVQPKGANGVTYDIQNWDDYAKDPAVLAWKTTNEATAASINVRKVLPAMREGMNKSVLRIYTGSVGKARTNSWHVPKKGVIMVHSAEMNGETATLTMCMWNPSVAFYTADGRVVGEVEKSWNRQISTLSQKSGHWVTTAFKFDGYCKEAAPA